MDFFTALEISASGLSVQRIRMNIISSNLANAQSTRTPQGGPYKKKEVIICSKPLPSEFNQLLRGYLEGKLSQVEVVGIIEKPDAFKMVYDPHHPDADKQGYVVYPDINVVEEMVNLLTATRSYEANITAIKALQNMALKALEISR